MRKRVLFRLTMPNAGSWNGRWSGEGQNYILVRSLPEARVKELGIPKTWHYSWGDGWGANVSARVMDKGERAPKSDGFCGYDWMVDRMIRWGTMDCQHEWAHDPNSGKTGWEGEWERCRWCRNGRKVSAQPAAIETEGA